MLTAAQIEQSAFLFRGLQGRIFVGLAELVLEAGAEIDEFFLATGIGIDIERPEFQNIIGIRLILLHHRAYRRGYGNRQVHRT